MTQNTCRHPIISSKIQGKTNSEGKIRHVGTQNDTIELNGYRYDARTGARLGRSESTSNAHKHRTVDGFVRRSAGPSQTITPKKVAPSHAVHNKISKSRTLRRQGLAKPVIKKTDAATNPATPIAKPSLQPHPTRLARAAQTKRSQHVSKFRPTATYKPLEIKTAPKETLSAAPASEQMPKRTMLPLSPFDMALQSADSHQEKPLPKLSLRERISKKLHISPRTLSAGFGVLLVLTIGGYFARQHMSELAVQLAATRAGIEARLPSYEPAGFSLAGPIEYSAGQIALSYQSNSDSRNFKIVQKKSDWNSQALLDNFIKAADKTFQTVQDKGKTIYIYDGNNATWVSGGVWYQVEGESSLNTDQLLRIASGL